MRQHKGLKKRLIKKLVRYHGQYIRNDRTLKVKPGDLLHDCDGFNHRVKSIEFFRFQVDKTEPTCVAGKSGVKPRGKPRWFLYDFDAIREDGKAFCGCPSFPEKPASRADIESYWLGWDCPEGLTTIGDFRMNPAFDTMVKTLREGGHFCDEDGVLLPEFARLIRERELISEESER